MDCVCLTAAQRSGDVLMLISGGHGFRMIENTVFLEVKRGPYIGPEGKGAMFTRYGHLIAAWERMLYG